MQEETRSTVWIAWGIGSIMAGAAFILGGPYWGWFMVVVGLALVLRGHFPKWFSSTKARVLGVASILLIGCIILGLYFTNVPSRQKLDASKAEQGSTVPPGRAPAQPNPVPPIAPTPEPSTKVEVKGTTTERKAVVSVNPKQARKQETPPAPEPPTGISPPLPGPNGGSVGTLIQGPCSVAQIGGSNNQATGGNCGPAKWNDISTDDGYFLLSALSPYKGRYVSFMLNQPSQSTQDTFDMVERIIKRAGLTVDIGITTGSSLPPKEICPARPKHGVLILAAPERMQEATTVWSPFLAKIGGWPNEPLPACSNFGDGVLIINISNP